MNICDFDAFLVFTQPLVGERYTDLRIQQYINNSWTIGTVFHNISQE